MMFKVIKNINKEEESKTKLRWYVELCPYPHRNENI